MTRPHPIAWYRSCLPPARSRNRDDVKNAKLKAERGIGFEDIVFHIERDDLLDILEHPNPERYADDET